MSVQKVSVHSLKYNTVPTWYVISGVFLIYLCIYMHIHNIHYIIYYIDNNYSIIHFCSQVGGKDNPAVDPIIHGLRGVVHHGEWQSCVKDHGGLNSFILRLCFVPKNVEPLFILTFMEATLHCFTICDSNQHSCCKFFFFVQWEKKESCIGNSV